jgi:hypothetical protein
MKTFLKLAAVMIIIFAALFGLYAALMFTIASNIGWQLLN